MSIRTPFDLLVLILQLMSKSLNDCSDGHAKVLQFISFIGLRREHANNVDVVESLMVFSDEDSET
jgi:hypothetical protein